MDGSEVDRVVRESFWREVLEIVRRIRMRKLQLIGLFLFTIASSVFAQTTGQYVLKGELRNYDKENIYLIYGLVFDGITFVDNATIKDGRFVITGEVEQPLAAFLSSGHRIDYMADIMFYIEET